MQCGWVVKNPTTAKNIATEMKQNYNLPKRKNDDTNQIRRQCRVPLQRTVPTMETRRLDYAAVAFATAPTMQDPYLPIMMIRCCFTPIPKSIGPDFFWLK
jgi:hypothetical protein